MKAGFISILLDGRTFLVASLAGLNSVLFGLTDNPSGFVGLHAFETQIAAVFDIDDRLAVNNLDLQSFPDDVPFYRARIPSPGARVLELGCGTGRVLIPLAPHCAEIVGIDISQAMLRVCREKLARAGASGHGARILRADITAFALRARFDLIIAPFRVFQNMETDAEIDGFFPRVREHLAPGGSCILNVFRPWDEGRIRAAWGAEGETFCWERPLSDGRVTCHEKRPPVEGTDLVLHPEAVYRRYEDADLAEQTSFQFVMRCYFPEEFERVIVSHGFRVVAKWGGYHGEPYGEGPELVIQFASDG